MKVVVHDYSGHPFQIQLSRGLAERGHEVVHQYCASYTTGRGKVELQPDDPPSLKIEAVELGSSFARYQMARRVLQELRYGWLAARAIAAPDPDVAVLSNIPLLSLVIVAAILQRRKVPYVFWQQDIYSAAISAAARQHLGPIGTAIGFVADRFERWVARRAAAVVPISGAFVEKLTGWGVRQDRIHVVPNWAPLDELPMRPKAHIWGTQDPVVLYSGTLGLKHDPMLLATAASALADVAEVVVISQGRGREMLEEAKSERGLTNLQLHDFQPYDRVPDVLASADILVALLEPHASRYSVPSKVLTYLSAGRPIVVVVPADNSIAEVIREADCGVVILPGDAAGFDAALHDLLADSDRRERMGANARAYAERTFDITSIATTFESILTAASS